MLHSTRRVAEVIRRYCATHPEARDTIDGITWWVALQRQEEMRAKVAEAVHELVRSGLLERFELRDGSEVFGCARRKPQDAESADDN